MIPLFIPYLYIAKDVWKQNCLLYFHRDTPRCFPSLSDGIINNRFTIPVICRDFQGYSISRMLIKLCLFFFFFPQTCHTLSSTHLENSPTVSVAIYQYSLKSTFLRKIDVRVLQNTGFPLASWKCKCLYRNICLETNAVSQHMPLILLLWSLVIVKYKKHQGKYYNLNEPITREIYREAAQ